MLKIDFSFDTQYGVFRDALYLPDDHGLADDEIAAMQQERLNNWLNVVENPPAPMPETIELDGVVYEKVDVDGQIVLKPVSA